jgi:hypothetical protein
VIVFEDGDETIKTGVLNEGDRVFVLGFPMNLVSAERRYVICRTGVIARIRDYIEGKSSGFLIDAPVFPGNSGGPVICCPAALAIEGTKHAVKADLIGMVRSYLPYIDVAISSQTGRARVMFEENSGLTEVEPVDLIRETVSEAHRRITNRIAQARFQEKKKKGQSEVVTSTVDPAPPAARNEDGSSTPVGRR